jgi:hypothetical protein
MFGGLQGTARSDSINQCIVLALLHVLGSCAEGKRLGNGIAPLAVAALFGVIHHLVLGFRASASFEKFVAHSNLVVADVATGPFLVHLGAHCDPWLAWVQRRTRFC